MLAFINGAVRELQLIPAFGLATGLLASGVILSLLALASIRWIGTSSNIEALHVGVLWVVLTLAFEFGFALLVARFIKRRQRGGAGRR